MANFFGDYLQAWNNHDAKAAAAFMTDDVVYEDVTLGEVHRGRDDVIGFIDGVATTFSSDYGFELVSAFNTDANYAAEWMLLGTHDRDGALPATNRPYRIRGVSFGVLRSGKIAENRDYWNMADFLGQVGLLRAPE